MMCSGRKSGQRALSIRRSDIVRRKAAPQHSHNNNLGHLGTASLTVTRFAISFDAVGAFNCQVNREETNHFDTQEC
jgi:hypothetical protein